MLTLDMHIRLIDDVPVSYRPYRLAYSERALVREIAKDLMDNGIIWESASPYSSPILLVKKTGEYRMCVDYRSLNAKTVKDTYPLPRVDNYFEKMYGNRYFTTVDLAFGYHQIKIAVNPSLKRFSSRRTGITNIYGCPLGWLTLPPSSKGPLTLF
jgi:hypothetical protein